jgi:hypothetical protein
MIELTREQAMDMRDCMICARDSGDDICPREWLDDNINLLTFLLEWEEE